MDSHPSEYNPPLPSGSYGPSDTHSYHPPGSIPTPVLIAQKIAENQGGSPTNIHPSAIFHRLSLESEQPLTEPQAKHGPPTAAKPSRFPGNISVVLGNKEHQSQSLPNVNLEERRAQMLANLSGASHPLQQENLLPAEEQSTGNRPGRSISFKDPTPDKSRMEALSKLGLNRSRALSDLPDILSSHIDKSQTSSSFPEPPPIKVNSYGGKSMTIQPGTGPTCRLPKAPVPIPVQRPARFTYHAGMAPPKTGRKNSLFRPQSISVEFCGRGPMNDARRAALRKLGLLKEPRTL
uniref:Proline and serine-rich protein 2 n=1 Tax=Gouania willdenowi TaxID=441366 RepID=A0A8C5NB56_GOUWI